VTDPTLAQPEAPAPCPEYRPLPGTFDEMCSAEGALRPIWDQVIPSLLEMGATELMRRRREARRLLEENGVTFNLQDSGEEATRPWTLDPIPQLVGSREWSRVEAGLIQRAELLERLAADLYGPRETLRKGLIPPEAVYAHPGFLRSCASIPAPGARLLPMYAADVGRAPNGSLWVTVDRTQALFGAGYALENRLVLSRVLPSLYRDAQVHRVATFFRALRRTLAELSPRDKDNPRVVMLSAGPGSETYFEHAYLANYLGYSLVEGGDLTVRGGKVWVKTLGGLQPVDVILRRIDAELCDPLELCGDSMLGTPGLLAAARARGVSIVNPLGSGMLENRALPAFLPALCRFLLGEELRIPSLATWWCGTPKERDYVVANLPRLVVRAIHPALGPATIHGAALSKQQRQNLVERIRARPCAYVGQEQIALSSTPVFGGRELEARHLMLRSFLVAHGDSYTVMPGGLARVSASTETAQFSLQKGGISKDTWVLASEPERPVSLLPPPGEAMPIIRSGGEVPSRVADNLFWLGRYSERLDAAARLLREVLQRLLDGEVPKHNPELTALLRTLTRQTHTAPGFIGKGAEERLAAPEREILSLLLDPARVGGLRFTLEAALGTCRGVRDRISDDLWRTFNSLAEEMRGTPRPYFALGRALQLTDRTVIAQTAISGFISEGMSRGAGWRFVDSGRRLERAVLTLALLDELLATPTAPASSLMETLLLITDSIRTYRRRYRSSLQLDAVLDLLLLDESNPRAVGFQLQTLSERIASLPRRSTPPHRSPEERLLLDALCSLRLADTETLLAVPEEGAESDLKRLLTRLGDRLANLSEAITHDYFSLTEVPQQLMGVSR
jgi:uncharacterized circularly permuted ATP-grasp superfamily protein/uncharacterized alpha-E superfamily protein